MKKALEKCDQSYPNVLRLICSSLFSVRLFPEKIVKEILASSLSLCKSVHSLLGAP